MQTPTNREPRPSIIQQVLARRDELKQALGRVDEDDPATRASIERALGALEPMLTGDLEHVPDVVSRDLVRWMEQQQHVAVTLERPATGAPTTPRADEKAPPGPAGGAVSGPSASPPGAAASARRFRPAEPTD